MARQTTDFPKPLMPKATAVGLIENTGLTFRQIGAFCELHELEVLEGEPRARDHRVAVAGARAVSYTHLTLPTKA